MPRAELPHVRQLDESGLGELVEFGSRELSRLASLEIAEEPDEDEFVQAALGQLGVLDEERGHGAVRLPNQRPAEIAIHRNTS